LPDAAPKSGTSPQMWPGEIEGDGKQFGSLQAKPSGSPPVLDQAAFLEPYASVKCYASHEVVQVTERTEMWSKPSQLFGITALQLSIGLKRPHELRKNEVFAADTKIHRIRNIPHNAYLWDIKSNDTISHILLTCGICT
jgi:hypothetical protein